MLLFLFMIRLWRFTGNTRSYSVVGLVIMMRGFRLLLMLFGVIGNRFGNVGLRELAVQSDVVAHSPVEMLSS